MTTARIVERLRQRRVSSARRTRQELPEAADYYARRLGRLRGSGPWRSARCPFHDDGEPSLSVNMDHGGFTCHACGVRGGDVLDFERRLRGCGYREALDAVGVAR